jgi:hypothetical protein
MFATLSSFSLSSYPKTLSPTPPNSLNTRHQVLTSYPPLRLTPKPFRMHGVVNAVNHPSHPTHLRHLFRRSLHKFLLPSYLPPPRRHLPSVTLHLSHSSHMTGHLISLTLRRPSSFPSASFIHSQPTAHLSNIISLLPSLISPLSTPFLFQLRARIVVLRTATNSIAFPFLIFMICPFHYFHPQALIVLHYSIHPGVIALHYLLIRALLLFTNSSSGHCCSSFIPYPGIFALHYSSIRALLLFIISSSGHFALHYSSIRALLLFITPPTRALLSSIVLPIRALFVLHYSIHLGTIALSLLFLGHYCPSSLHLSRQYCLSQLFFLGIIALHYFVYAGSLTTLLLGHCYPYCSNPIITALPLLSFSRHSPGCYHTHYLI